MEEIVEENLLLLKNISEHIFVLKNGQPFIYSIQCWGSH